MRELCALVRAENLEDDRINWVYPGSLEACLLSHEGDLEEAEARGNHALELADTTDYFFARGRARPYLATVLARAGRDSESAALASEGLAIFEAKGDVTGLGWARPLLGQRESSSADTLADAANVV